MNRRLIHALCAAAIAVLLVPIAPVSGSSGHAFAQGPVLVNGDFESTANVAQLRDPGKAPGWSESRKDGKIGPKLLKLSAKPIYGDKTKKAMIKGSAKKNTYLTQAFSAPQKGKFSLKWDIAVKEVFPGRNRSGFQMIGNASGGKAPNSTGAQRFVFLAFENAKTPGKVNLFAYEVSSPPTAEKRTPVASNLSLKKWYTVKVDVDVPGKTYTVTVPGATTAPVTVKAFDSGKGVPGELTHVSFASWNDGPGTFFVDNVGQP